MLNFLAFAIATSAATAASLTAYAGEQRDYGEYLSGECTACHRDGGNETIPRIAGYEALFFVELMEQYRNGERGNPAMVSVAKSLDKAQIEALAVYFASVKPK